MTMMMVMMLNGSAIDSLTTKVNINSDVMIRLHLLSIVNLKVKIHEGALYQRHKNSYMDRRYRPSKVAT
jgi:hypothetical protein